MSPRFYDTDLTDAAWAWVAPVLPAARPGGRQVRADPGPGGVVEIGVVASGAHGSRNRADEPRFARGGSISQTPSETESQCPTLGQKQDLLRQTKRKNRHEMSC
jgi:hypothetical protein